MKAQMHLDGCHFFAWVYETPDGRSEVTWYERTGEDLHQHADTSDCERCDALIRGAAPREYHAPLELPDEPKDAFLAVLTACAEAEAS